MVLNTMAAEIRIAEVFLISLLFFMFSPFPYFALSRSVMIYFSFLSLLTS